MPNNIQNKLQIIGNRVHEVREFIKGDEDHPDIDFNQIIPMAEDLQLDKSSIGEMAQTILFGTGGDEWIGIEELQRRMRNYGKEMRIEAVDLALKYQRNLEKHGFSTWYDWAIENWGTKWNAYSQNDDRSSQNTIWFQTAWSMPENIIVALSKKYPKTKFKIEWASEDTGYNVGMKTFQNGEVIDERIPEGGSKEAYEFCFALHPHREQYYELEGGEYQFTEE